MQFFAMLSMLVMLPLSFLFAGISGTYQVHGGDPSDGSTYTGTLVIEKVDEVYTASWMLSDGSSTGTGVRKGDNLAIVFVGVDANNNPLTGVQLYKIEENTLTSGPWTIYGSTTKGFEVAQKEHHHSGS